MSSSKERQPDRRGPATPAKGGKHEQHDGYEVAEQRDGWHVPWQASGMPTGPGGQHLRAIIDFCIEHAPREVEAWVRDMRASMSDWEEWRSREVIFVKPRKNARDEVEYVSKHGRVIPAEVIRREWERIEKKDEPA